MSVRSVNCTRCSAPLELLGGHRIESLSCGYCGAILDPHERCKVVGEYAKALEITWPFKLGLSGRLKGIDFVITGALSLRTADGSSSWLEYQLYSPLRGYAFLSLEGGHFVLSRRVRYRVRWPAGLPAKTRVLANGQRYQKFSEYKAVVVSAVGALTWLARPGDETRCVDCIAPPHILSVERAAGETEVHLGEYLEAQEVLSAFGVEAGRPRYQRGFVHPAQPYKPWTWLSDLHGAVKPFLLGSLLIAGLIALLFDGREVYRYRLDQPVPVRHELNISSARNPVAILLQAGVNNSWASYEFEISRDGETVFSLEQELSYYHGVEGGERWTEGSRKAKALVRFPAPGRYQVLSAQTGGDRLAPLSVSIRENYVVSRYFWILSAVLLLPLGLAPLRRAHFESARWADEMED